MVERLTYIELGEQSFPMKCDLAVLEMIQDEYGTVNEFERKLLGIAKKEDGTDFKTEPSIKAIRFVLPLMINEGIDIENAKNGTKREHVTNEDIKTIAGEYHAFELADEIHTEFSRCFASKNRKSTQEA